MTACDYKKRGRGSTEGESERERGNGFENGMQRVKERVSEK